MCALHPIKINQQLESIFMPAVVKILQECKVYDSKLTKYIILIIPDLCVVVIFHQVGGGRIFNDNNSD